jgi:8-oxo-dGTP pyrophosphatase MutT (NUDIX family)
MSERHRRYVAGFLMRGGEVLLVRKNRPTWQDGLMNAIGGEINEGEKPEHAMLREFQEETGLVVTNWSFFATETGPGYEVLFYRSRIPPDTRWTPPRANDVGEEIAWCEMDTAEPCIGNLGWLLPLCLDPRDIIVNARTTSDIRKIMTW